MLRSAVEPPLTGGNPERSAADVAVRHLRQVLLWPLRLIPTREPMAAGAARRTPWQILRDMGAASPWQEVVDEYTGDKASFHERHYNEFVTFLPYVQRFLYGDGRSARDAAGRDAELPDARVPAPGRQARAGARAPG